MPVGRFDGAGFAFFLAAVFGVAVAGALFGCPCADAFSGLPPAVGDGEAGVLLVVDVELLLDEDEPELEVEPDELGVELVVEEEELGGALVVDDVVVVDEDDEAGAHVMLEETITPLIGRLSADTGVPGTLSTLNVYVWPPSTVTVTVHGSAEADGIAAMAVATSSAPRRTSILASLRRLITVARLLRASSCGALPMRKRKDTLRRRP